MTRPNRVLIAVVAAIVVGAGSASAQICVSVDAACNDYFFAVSRTSAPDVYALDGFEYGCALSRTRHASGVVRVKPDRIEIEFTGTNRLFDYTQAVNWSGELAIPSLASEYKVQYTYLSGGVLTAHGATGTFSVAGCAEPAALLAKAAPDTAARENMQ